MNIYVEIMTIYGITFLVSMFVALIIWVLSKLIDFIPDEPFTIKRFISDMHQNINTAKENRKQFLKDCRETKTEASKNLNSMHHEHA